MIELCTCTYWQQSGLSDSISGTGPQRNTRSTPLHVTKSSVVAVGYHEIAEEGRQCQRDHISRGKDYGDAGAQCPKEDININAGKTRSNQRFLSKRNTRRSRILHRTKLRNHCARTTLPRKLKPDHEATMWQLTIMSCTLRRIGNQVF